jgi:DNA-directed RNA polymerase beta subunit
MAEVYLNSKFVGNVDNPIEFVSKIRDERRKGIIAENLNVYYNEKPDEVQLESSKGRARRPLIIVKDGVPLLTEKHIKQLEKNEISWSDLVKQGIIEYLDAAEEENTLVAFFESELTPEYTHLEITPLGMLGY